MSSFEVLNTRNADLLEKVQGRITKVVKGLEHLSCRLAEPVGIVEPGEQLGAWPHSGLRVRGFIKRRETDLHRQVMIEDRRRGMVFKV